MRLNKKEKEVILNLAKKYFGQNTKVFVFGSRLEDKKGGDIDLYIEPENYDLEKRGAFKFRIKEILFKPVDVVFSKENIDKLEEIKAKNVYRDLYL